MGVGERSEHGHEGKEPLYIYIEAENENKKKSTTTDSNL